MEKVPAEMMREFVRSQNEVLSFKYSRQTH